MLYVDCGQGTTCYLKIKLFIKKTLLSLLRLKHCLINLRILKGLKKIRGVFIIAMNSFV